MKKYKLINPIIHNDQKLYQIKSRNASLRNNVHVSGYANVTATLDGNETITGDAIVDSSNDVFCVKLKDNKDNHYFPENNYITYTKSNDM